MDQTFPDCSDKKMQSSESSVLLSRIEEAKKRHLMNILQTAEQAKNSSLYETYDYHLSSSDSSIKVFLARRKGRSHIKNNKPCQDFCMASEFGNYTVLTDADGVSACEYSQIGSQLACQAVVSIVQEAAEYCKTEEQFVKNLKSIYFRERVVKKWIINVQQHIINREFESQNMMKEIHKYGATIIFSVITPNWYIIGNLGDGQALVFNDTFGIKIRTSEKESSKVRCLVNTTCAREDFVIDVFPRSVFNGVLLSTDGMYDILEPSDHFFKYAMQLKARFLANNPPEPSQPFCYEEEGEPLKEISQIRTMDDCSIAMAIDEATVQHEDYDSLIALFTDEIDFIQIERWSRNVYFFSAEYDKKRFEIIGSLNPPVKVDLEIEGVIWDDPVKSWMLCNEDNCYYQANLYSVLNIPTIEDLYLNGNLRAHNTSSVNDLISILELYKKISLLRNALHEKGLMLNNAAHFLISYDGRILHVKKEAITQKSDLDSDTILESYFSNIIGALKCKNVTIPLFDPGYIKEGFHISGVENNQGNHQMICRVEKEDGPSPKYQLINIGIESWCLMTDIIVKPKGQIPLAEAFSFCLGDQYDNKNEIYLFIPKKEL